jgi:hypothetical protein
VVTDTQFSPAQIRATLGRFCTGVTVVTTADSQGAAVHAMTANAFTSVSLDPALVLVSIDHRARMHQLLPATGRYGVSVLAADQERIALHFAGRPLADHGELFEWTAGVPFVRRDRACRVQPGCLPPGRRPHAVPRPRRPPRQPGRQPAAVPSRSLRADRPRGGADAELGLVAASVSRPHGGRPVRPAPRAAFSSSCGCTSAVVVLRVRTPATDPRVRRLAGRITSSSSPRSRRKRGWKART